MASACVNNNIGMSPENFLNCPPAKYPSYGWLSPRISFSREFPDEEAPKSSANNKPNSKNEEAKKSDPEICGNDFVDFEFRLEDPVTMLPADELFSDGKLVPLQLSTTIRQSTISVPASSDVRSPDTPKFRRKIEISSSDPYLFSPKAPRCSSRWKELLGLKKLYQNSANAKNNEDQKISSLISSDNNNGSSRSNAAAAARGLKHFLHRSSKSSSSIDSSINLPLLRDTDNNNELISISARLSLSSSSSGGHEYDDLPRLSLDSDKPSSRNARHTASKLSRVRQVKRRAALSSENPTAAAVRAGRSSIRKAPADSTIQMRGVSVDSPRMNSSGKIVFHSLERSSSSPSTFNGAPRHKHRGMERSYSANIRVTPVLNVPVCSLRGSSKSGVFGLPLFSSQQKKDYGSGVSNRSTQPNHSKNRT